MPNDTVRPVEPPSQVLPVRPSFQKRPLPYKGLTSGSGAGQARDDAGEHVALIEIDFDEGTEYYSFDGVSAPDRHYKDYVTAIGPIHREISIYSGQVSIGNVRLAFANRHQFWSRKLRSQDFRGRDVRVKYVNVADGLGSALVLFEGQIVSWRLANGVLDLDCRDTRSDELFEQTLAQTVPMLRLSNFPLLPPGQVPVMAPLIMGRIANVTGETAADTPGGAAPTYLGDDAAFVYIVAARPLGANPAAGTVTQIYVYLVVDTGAAITTVTINSHVYAAIDFASSQRSATRPNEMEVTGFFSGFTEDDNVASTPILNPVRALEYILDNYTALEPANFDSTLQTAAKTAASSQGYADDATTLNPAVLGMILSDHKMTIREVVERFCESFGMSFYATRSGLLATIVHTDEPDTSSDFTVDDETDILSGSFSVESNPQIATIIQVNHAFRWTSGKPGDPMGSGMYFERQPDYVIAGAKTQLGGDYDVRANVNLWFCRNTQKAMEVARSIGEFYKPNAEWIRFNLPLTKWWRHVDLNRYVGITHWQGPSLERNTPRGEYLGYDTFDRANSNSLGSSWTESEHASDPTVLTILSNQLRMTVVDAARSGVAIIAGTYGARQVARALFVDTAFGADSTIAGVFVRGAGTVASFTGFAAIVVGEGTSGTLRLWRFSGTSLSNATISGPTVLASVAANGAADSALEPGDTLELRVKEVGDSAELEVWVISEDPDRNGLAIGPITATTISGGAPGFLTHFNNGSVSRTSDWDNFVALNSWQEEIASGYENVIARIIAMDIVLQPESAHIELRCFHRPAYTSVNESFTAANGNTLPSGWTESEYAADVFSILSNQLRMTTSDTQRSAVAFRAEGFGQNQLARARFMAMNFSGATTPYAGVAVRGQGTVGAFTGFAAFILGQGVGNGTLRLWRFAAVNLNNATIGAGTTALASVAANGATGSKFEPGDEIELRVERNADGDTELSVYVYSQNSARNGRVIGPVTATDIAGGTPGFFTHYNNTGSLTSDWDDFSARDF